MTDSTIKLLIIGATGQVGRYVLAQANQDEDFTCIIADRDELDITKPDSIIAALKKYTPHYVINGAAYTDVEKAESDQTACYALNRDAVGYLAKACQQLDIPLLQLSTDYVFDGKKATPYSEQDAPAPINVYGMSKWQGEELLQKHTTRYILLRVSGVFSPWRKNFVKSIFDAFKAKKPLRVINDQTCCPTGAADIARVLLAIVKQLHCGANAWGIYHYVAADIMTWHGFAEAIVREAAFRLALNEQSVAPISSDEYPTQAQRPKNAVLDCQKILSTFGIQQRSWQDDLVQTVEELSK